MHSNHFGHNIRMVHMKFGITYVNWNKTGNNRYNEARSRNHCCSGKTVSIPHSECVSLALVIHHVKRMRRIVLSSVACPAILQFFTLFHKRHDFRENVTEHKMCVLIFSTTFIWNVCHSTDTARYHKCAYSARYSCQILMKLVFSRQFSKKTLKYQISWKSFQWELRCSIPYGSDGNTFRYFATPLKIRLQDERYWMSRSSVYQYWYWAVPGSNPCLEIGYPDSVTMFQLFLTRFSSVPHRASDKATTPSFQMNSKFVPRISPYWRCRYTGHHNKTSKR
jgi:hypothetical protein